MRRLLNLSASLSLALSLTLSLGFFVPPSLAFASPLETAVSKALSNPLAMTVTQVLVGPKKDRFTRDQVTVIPGRSQTFLYEKYGKLGFTYRLQKNKSAPLVFIIPGTGGTSESPAALFVAEELFAKGYHTVTMDDAFSFTFSVAGSRSSLPGYTPRDAADLYEGLKKVTGHLMAKKEIHPRSYSLVGYSLGGLQSVFLHHLDQEKQNFRFKKVLIVDPPMDLFYAVSGLDHLFNVGERLSRGRKLYVFNRSLEVGNKYLENPPDFSNLTVLDQIFAELNFTDADFSYLIGGSFRDSLRDVIFVSQQVKDLKILKSPVSRYKRNQRYEEARQFSFQDYMTRFVLPSVKATKGPDYGVADMNRESSFYQFGDYVQTHQNIFLVHTADDFVLQDGDLEWLQEKFGPRAMILPYGGHCGGMNLPQFHQHLSSLFSL